MGKNKKSIQYYLEKMVEMSDVIDTSDIFNDANIEVNILTNEKEYNHLLSNFREMDRDKEKFTIEINDMKFNFEVKN